MYKQIAKEARLKILGMIHKAQTSHIGSNLSVIDILTVLYEKAYINKEDWENRDRIILSKGWAAASLYYNLWRIGLITEEELDSYCQLGSKFIGLAEPVADGIEFAGGSMGHGLPAGVGMALAAKKLKKTYKVYVVMSDGELNCGTTWESLMIAGHHHLDNLVIIVDSNGWQAMGRTKDILGDWGRGRGITHAVNEFVLATGGDGHDFDEIEKLLEWPRTDRIETQGINDRYGNKIKQVPHMIFFNTVKGKGVSFMEDKLEWHYKNIDDESYRKAVNELS